MMKVVMARNVHQALPEKVLLATSGLSEPVMFHYANPTERLVFWEEIDANPFDQLFDGLAYLRNTPTATDVGRHHKGTDTYEIKLMRNRVHLMLYTPILRIGEEQDYSLLLEYAAARTGLSVGAYSVTTLKLEVPEKLKELMWEGGQTCMYEDGYALNPPLVSRPSDVWWEDLKMFLDEGAEAVGYRDPFFRKVAVPMLQAWTAYTKLSPPEKFNTGIKILSEYDHDWAIAGEQWLNRKVAKWTKK